MTILQMNLSASLIIALTVIIRSVALDKLPKQIFQLFWLVACLRLLLPFSFHSNISIYNLFGNRQTPADLSAPAAPAPVLSPAAPAPTAGAPVSAAESFPFLMVAWLIGIAVMAAGLLFINLRSMRNFGTSLPHSHSYTSQWLRLNQIRRKVCVRISDRVAAPLTYGFLRPVILLPKSLDLSDTESLRYIFTHEMLHIKRFDLVKKLVLTVTLCVYWFNPMVWVMYILANRDIELSCDEGVLRALGTDQNAAYALTLISMQEKKGGATLTNHFSKNAIKERITSIMKVKKISALAITAALVLVVGATAAFASTAMPQENDGKAPDTQAETQTDTNSGITISYTDPDTGETRYSDDDGKTFMTQKEWDEKYPSLDVVWWTAEEYEAWLEQERQELPKLIGDKGWNAQDGWFEWTQERVDEAIAMYEETLEEIKRGVSHSKTVDGRDDIALAQNLSDMETEQGYGAVISNGESEKTFDSEDKDQLDQDVAEYLDNQVKNGGMTEAEAAEVLEGLQKQ